jgi:hypothetical protein
MKKRLGEGPPPPPSRSPRSPSPSRPPGPACLLLLCCLLICGRHATVFVASPLQSRLVDDENEEEGVDDVASVVAAVLLVRVVWLDSMKCFDPS